MILLPSGIVNDDRLSTSSKQLRHIVNNIILDKKKGNNGSNIVHRHRVPRSA